jgi:hypothetical protein
VLLVVTLAPLLQEDAATRLLRWVAEKKDWVVQAVKNLKRKPVAMIVLGSGYFTYQLFEAFTAEKAPWAWVGFAASAVVLVVLALWGRRR